MIARPFPFIFFALFLFMSPYLVKAQEGVSGWLATFNTFKLGNRTSLQSDPQLRSSSRFFRVQTVLLRAGFNYHLNKQVHATLGYAFISNYRASGNIDGHLPEHRIWQQLLINQKIGSANLAHRFRLEQRFISIPIVKGDMLKANGYDYANRIRYFARYLQPLKKVTAFAKGSFIAVQNEVFFNFGNRRAVNGKYFDQNRAYVAIGYRFSKAFDAEVGYMNQYIDGRGNAFTRNNIVQLATYLRL